MTAIYSSLLLQCAALVAVGYTYFQKIENTPILKTQTLELKSSSPGKLLYRKNIEDTIQELRLHNVNERALERIELLRKKPEGILLLKKLITESKYLNKKMVINERPYLTKLSSSLVAKLEHSPILSDGQTNARISESLKLLKLMKAAALSSNMKDFEKIDFIEVISNLNNDLNEFDNIEKNIQSISAQMLALKAEFDNKKQTQISRIYEESQRKTDQIYFMLLYQIIFLTTTIGLTLLAKTKTKTLINENTKSLEETLSKLILTKDRTRLNTIESTELKRNIKRNLDEADGAHFINEFLSSSIPFPTFIVDQNKIIIWANKSMQERGSIDDELIKKQLLTSDMLFKILGLSLIKELDTNRPIKTITSGEEISFFNDSKYPGFYVAIVHEAKDDVPEKHQSYTEATPPPLPLEARPRYLSGSCNEVSLSFCLSKNILIQTRQMIDKNVKIDLGIDEKIYVNVNEEKFNELLKTALIGLTGDSLPNKTKLIKISGVSENSMYYLVIDHFNPINQVLSEVLNHLSVDAGVNYKTSGNRMLLGMLSLSYQLERGQLMDL
jgi:hypothetical protein